MREKVVKTEAEYASALAELERLVAIDPPAGSADGERLELLGLLVSDYESKRFPRELPDPIAALKFRMEQQNLSPRDLIPYIGSRSKVSEVLSRKRSLTLSMIRALHRGLGIPAESLLHDRNGGGIEEPDPEWSRFPIREMVSRGWIAGLEPGRKYDPEEVVRRFLAPLGPNIRVPVLYRKTNTVRSARSMDRHALAAWTLRIIIQSLNINRDEYRPGTVTVNFMREVAQLSCSTRGPLLAQELLAKQGIALVIESHLPRTHLDAAALLIEDKKPIIGLTLRHDRLDNFWFSLMHELAHIGLHLHGAGDSFYDDLDSENTGNAKEAEADELAGEALIPRDAWEASPARHLRSPEAAQHLAEQLRIHPSIVAGRMRHQADNFHILTHLVGRGTVRAMFEGKSEFAGE